MSFFTGIAKLFGVIGKWSSVGISFMPYIGQAMTIVEMLSSLKGISKKKQAVDLTRLLVNSSESFSGRDMFNDADVIKAVEAVIDAQVALQNLLAKKGA